MKFSTIKLLLTTLLCLPLSFSTANEKTYTPRIFKENNAFEIVAHNGVAQDQFGRGVAISGDYMAISSDHGDTYPSTNGAVYIYQKTANDTWSQIQTIESPAPVPSNTGYISGEWFGYRVALDGKHLAVTAISANVAYDTDKVRHNQGVVYMYYNDGSSWVPSGRLSPSDVTETKGGRHIGDSVSVSGNRVVLAYPRADIVIGSHDSRGAAYVYHFDTASKTWGNEVKITASDGEDVAYYFGRSVAISDKHLVVGAAQIYSGGAVQGSAYVFDISGSAYVEKQKILETTWGGTDNFAYSLDVDGNHLAIRGADGRVGKVHLYHYNGTEWTELQELIGGNGYPFDLHGNRLVVGHKQANGWRGEISTYRFANGNWGSKQTIANTNGAYNDQMGFSVAISENHVAAGAVGTDIAGNNNQGKVYVYTDPFVFVDGFE